MRTSRRCLFLSAALASLLPMLSGCNPRAAANDTRPVASNTQAAANDTQATQAVQASAQASQTSASDQETQNTSDPIVVQLRYVDITPSSNTEKEGFGSVADRLQSAGDALRAAAKTCKSGSILELYVTGESQRPRLVTSIQMEPEAVYKRRQRINKADEDIAGAVEELRRNPPVFKESPIVEDMRELVRRAASLARQQSARATVHILSDGQQFSARFPQSRIATATDIQAFANSLAKPTVSLADVSCSVTLTRGTNENGAPDLEKLKSFYEALGTAWNLKITVEEL